MATGTSGRCWALVAVVLLAATIGGGAFAWSALRPGPPLEISLPEHPPSQGQVFIGGYVTRPGIYPFAGSDSVDDLLAAAGGMRANADPSRLELRAVAAEAGDEPQRIDINRAEAWLLEALPGIGEVRAQAIIDYRTDSGPYLSVDGLLRVAGIGEAVLSRIRPLVTVSD